MIRRRFASATLAMLVTASAAAQVGKPVTIVDANIATEKELSAMPHMTAALVKAVVAGRPFQSATDLDKLLGQTLSAEQRKELYGKLFVHLNLNTWAGEGARPDSDRMAGLIVWELVVPDPQARQNVIDRLAAAGAILDASTARDLDGIPFEVVGDFR